jgi:hypothetical protein
MQPTTNAIMTRAIIALATASPIPSIYSPTIQVQTRTSTIKSKLRVKAMVRMPIMPAP